ncbi:virulence factor family protein [Methylobacterium organophilum]|uniref:AcvB/VirJ family lysyl-phosphatidylglycerol hydrolase n=1 Tax=Methylobacterium organophilum TaxID=410 RepID=UPI001F1474C5|nr:AcvB/VirJ family lysyl-phosphatidylglycerol hydrolase [Methylobacterium organophilum]UMY18121.1 virulence factor family protein [Methylobacterium organophilum]
MTTPNAAPKPARRRRLLAAAALILAAGGGAFALKVLRPSPTLIAAATPVKASSGRIKDVSVDLPDHDPTGLAILISDRDGIGAREKAVEAALRHRGLIVMSLDLGRVKQGLAKEAGACVNPYSDIEELSKEAQRELGAQRYFHPVVIGLGEGGTMARAIAGQTLAATLAGVVALDPAPVLAMPRPACGPSAPAEGGFAYPRAEHLQAPLTVIAAETAPAGPTVPGAGPFAPEQHPEAEAGQRQAQAIDAVAAMAAQDSGTDSLPLVDLPASGTPKALAVFFSGDGGWRTIDKVIGEQLAQDGIHVVGVDALRYFWADRSPQTVAADTTAIVRQADPSGRLPVIVLGFSFGADVFPFSWPHLPDALRKRVSLIGLLGPGRSTGFSVSVKGFLGMGGAHEVVPQIAGLPPQKVLCVYGSEEKAPACTDPSLAGVAKVRLEGGHHFDGDYAAIARRLIEAARISG